MFPYLYADGSPLMDSSTRKPQKISVAPDYDTALIISLVFLLSREDCDKRIIFALLYILT